MPIEVTARHLNISETLQEHARARAAELAAEFPKIEHVHVILEVERHRYRAEYVVQHKGLAKVEASETTDDMVASIDRAAEHVEKQLRRHHEKVVDAHHHHRR
jgi:putative sigma-54 modulation protein